jgi:hypothetical protein
MRAISTLALALLGVGCGRQDLDLLVATERADPCLAIEDEDECDESATLGCAFQPNLEGCRSDDPSCRPGICRRGDPFVRRVDRSFLLNGEQFRFAGVSSWALLQPAPCATTEPENRLAWLTQAFDDLVPSRSKVVRAFAFQNSAGAGGNDFSFLDAAVDAARRAGIRLIFVLEHNDGGCSDELRRDAVWYASGFREPYGGYQLSYRAYAEALATRYRDEPTVLGYTLMQSLGTPDTAAVASFVTEIGQLLHGIAPSQLVSLDLSWYTANENGGAVYRQLQSLPVVDFVDVDDYSTEDGPPLEDALLQMLRELDKPAIIGEGAFPLASGDDAALAVRGARASERMQRWRDWGFAGALLWAYQPGWAMVSEEFDARPADPLLRPGGVLASAPW